MQIEVISVEDIPQGKTPKTPSENKSRLAEVLDAYTQLEAGRAMRLEFEDSKKASSFGFFIKNRFKKLDINAHVSKRRNQPTLYIRAAS